MSIEVMKQALEALKANQPINFCLNNNNERFPIFTEDPFRFERNEKAMDLLRQAIERAENNVLAERERIEELEKITGDMADAAIELHEKYEESQSADVKAMNEAQIVLQTIKDIDPGVYDEMIDNALRLIADALNIVAEEEVK